MRVTRFFIMLLALSNPALWATQPVTSPAPATNGNKFHEILASKPTLKRIQAGGYVLYLRHGPTDNSRPDRYPAVDLDDCQTQRPLTDDGRQLASQIGKSIHRAGIPIAEIRISPLCRVKDTAAAAFPGKNVAIDLDLMYTANLTQAQKAPILANTRHWLSAPVAAGSNRLLIAHGPNLMDTIGYFPKEATLVIFQPKGSAGFDYVASIPPAHWASLGY